MVAVDVKHHVYLLRQSFAAALGWPLQGAGLVKGDMEDKLLPMQRVPLSTSMRSPPLHVTEVPPLHVTEVPPLHVTEVPSLSTSLSPSLPPPTHPPTHPHLRHVTDVIQGKGKSPYSLAPALSQELPEVSM